MNSKQKDMKINKVLVKELLNKKVGKIGEAVRAIEVIHFSSENRNRIADFFTNYKKIEEILFTIDYLEKEKLIEIENSNINTSALDLDPTNYDGTDNIHERIEFAFDGLKKVWESKFKINFTLYSFIKNNFKTDSQRKDEKNFWLPVGIALFNTGVVMLGYIINLLIEAYKAPIIIIK